MFKSISIIIAIISAIAVFSFPLSAQDEYNEAYNQEMANKILAKAYNQDGYFCEFWHDCMTEEDPCDGVYYIAVKMKDDLFFLKIDLPNRDLENTILQLPVGTPINFDFKIHYLYSESGGEWEPTVSLTRVETTGPANLQNCPTSTSTN
jgi:hypothetical protein